MELGQKHNAPHHDRRQDLDTIKETTDGGPTARGRRSHGWGLFCLCLLFTACAHVPNKLKPDEVTIVAVSNLDGEILPREGQGGLAKLGGWIEVERARAGRQLLVLAGGNHLSGSLLAEADHGRCVFEALEAVGVAAYGAGDRDAQHPAFKELSASARSPLLWANQKALGAVPNLYRSVLLRAGDNLVGVTSVTREPGWAQALMSSASVLRREGAHFVVAFAPVGRRFTEDLSGIDLVISTEPKELGLEVGSHRGVLYPGRAGIFATAVTLSRSGTLHADGPHVLGPETRPSSRVEDVIQEGLDRTRETRLASLGQLSDERKAADLAAEAVRAQTGADVAIIQPGAARGQFSRGSIARQALNDAIAIDDGLVVMTVPGYELARLLRVINSGARGQASVSGLKLELIDPEERGKTSDLDGDGKIAHWEVNRLKSIRTASGVRFDQKRSYRIALPNYLANGGDDLAWVVANLHPKQIERPNLTLRTALEKHLKTPMLH